MGETFFRILTRMQRNVIRIIYLEVFWDYVKIYFSTGEFSLNGRKFGALTRLYSFLLPTRNMIFFFINRKNILPISSLTNLNSFLADLIESLIIFQSHSKLKNNQEFMIA